MLASGHVPQYGSNRARSAERVEAEVVASTTRAASQRAAKSPNRVFPTWGSMYWPRLLVDSTSAKNRDASRLVGKVLARCRAAGSRQFARQVPAGVLTT